MSETELRVILSVNIKRLRNRREWSQAALAEHLGISPNFLSEIETGKTWVSPLTLVKLADALNVAVYELFKPSEPLDADVKTTMERFVQDMSIALSRSLSHAVQKSVRKTLIKTLNESLQNVCNQ